MDARHTGESTADPHEEIRRLEARVAELENALTRSYSSEHDDLLTAVLETSVAAICVLDAKGQIVFANPAAETVLGLTSSDITRRRYNAPAWKATALDGGDWSEDEYPFTRVMSTGRPVRDVRHAIEWPDGRRRLLSINGAPILDADGRITRLVFSIRDITERLKIEERMRESDTWLRMALETTQMGIWSWSVTTNQVRWSDEVTSLFKLDGSSSPRTYESFLDMVHPEDVGKVQDAVETAFASDASSLTIEYRLRRADGEETWVEARGHMERDEDGRVSNVTGTVADTTGRKRVELALRASEVAFRTLLETVPSYIVSVDRNRSIRFLNRTLPHLDMADVIGKDVVQFMTEESRDEYARALERAFETGELQELEGTAISPDGKPSAFLLRMGPVKKDDVVETVTIVGVDVTQLKRAEEALLASQEQLRHAQRLESVGRLAGGVAHDFNNLLTVIMGCLELLEPKLEGRPELLDLTRPIADAAERGSTLTRQLLAFARKKVVRPRVLDINEQIRTSYDLLRRLIGEDIELDLILSGDLWPIKIDPGQFEQVLINLAVNARDAMPTGGRIAITSKNVTLPASDGDGDVDWVRVAMRDTGVGIDAETLPFIFEPFFTTKRSGEGTGLGLATCFGIIGQAGGCIDVDTTPGKGTEFRVWLPRAEGTSKRTTTADPGRIAAEGNGTVLLVEDEVMVRNVTQSILQRAGYHVLEAGNGQQALEVFQEHAGDIDLVITDIAMPRMSGITLARELIRLKPDARVLLVSGYARERDLPVEGSVHLLEKPYSADGLMKAIREVLSND